MVDRLSQEFVFFKTCNHAEIKWFSRSITRFKDARLHDKSDSKMKSRRFTGFLVWFSRSKETREWETGFSRDGNLLKTQIDDRLRTFSQGSTTLKPLQSNVNIVRQVNEQFISWALYVKVPEEHIGTKKGDCFINNIGTFCIKFHNTCSSATRKFIDG